MYDASSDAKNAKTAAISLASPGRPIGMWLSTSARAFASPVHDALIGVTIAPGPTAFTRMPRSAYSSASVFVRFSIPPLVIE